MINIDWFNNLFDDNVELTMMPDFPMLKFRCNKIEYSVTDLKYLNESAKALFEYMLTRACNEPMDDEITFEIPEDFAEESLKICLDIVINVRFTAKKKGRNGFTVAGCFLTRGYRTRSTTEDGRRFVTIGIRPEHAKHIYEYAQEREANNGGKPVEISLPELVVEVFEREERAKETDNVQNRPL